MNKTELINQIAESADISKKSGRRRSTGICGCSH